MTDLPPPADDPTAAELAALRKEKADRDAAERAERDKELEELRAFKAAETEKAAKAVKAPARRPADPTTTPAPTGAPALATAPKRRKGRGGASRAWFGEEDE